MTEEHGVVRGAIQRVMMLMVKCSLLTYNSEWKTKEEDGINERTENKTLMEEQRNC
jgi:hypothetical protein